MPAGVGLATSTRVASHTQAFEAAALHRIQRVAHQLALRLDGVEAEGSPHSAGPSPRCGLTVCALGSVCCRSPHFGALAATTGNSLSSSALAVGVCSMILVPIARNDFIIAAYS